VQAFIGNVIEEVVAHERDELIDAMQKRDRAIERLEVELTKTQAELAKLNLRVVEMSVDRDRERGKVLDLPPLPKSRELN
jgi:hypothetical protein